MHQEPRAGMKQCPHVGPGKAAPLGLCRWLPEASLQGRSVAHGKTRAIQGPSAMSMPAACLLRFRDQSIASALQQHREYAQRQTLACLAVCRGCKRHTSQTRQGRASCVAMQNLQKKDMDGSHGIQNTLTPDVPQAITDVPND